MKIIINGKEEEINEGFSIGDLLRGRDLDFDSVVVEHNTAIIDKADYDNIQLKDKEVLEVLRFVGGG